MPGLSSASHWLVALMIFANSAWADAIVRLDPESEWRNAESIAVLVEIFDTWLDHNTDFQRPETSPKIEFISSSFATSIQGSSASRFGHTRGLYDPDTSTIFLILPWDRKNPHDASVLLHELVHARQASRYYYCPGAQEEAPYRLQDEWLRERGLQANVNWIAVVLESGCNRRDFHPD